jgi:hypothetical protein
MIGANAGVSPEIEKMRKIEKMGKMGATYYILPITYYLDATALT